MPSNLFLSNYIVWRPLFSFHLPSKKTHELPAIPAHNPPKKKSHPMPLQRSIGIRTAALQGFHINGEFDGIYSCLGPEIIQTCLQSQLPTMEVHGRKLGSAGIHHVDVPWWSGEPMVEKQGECCSRHPIGHSDSTIEQESRIVTDQCRPHGQQPYRAPPAAWFPKPQQSWRPKKTQLLAVPTRLYSRIWHDSLTLTSYIFHWPELASLPPQSWYTQQKPTSRRALIRATRLSCTAPSNLLVHPNVAHYHCPRWASHASHQSKDSGRSSPQALQPGFECSGPRWWDVRKEKTFAS